MASTKPTENTPIPQSLKTAVSDGFLPKRHPKCKGDGIDYCGYETKIDCDECKYNGENRGGKDPNAKCNWA